MKKSAFYLLSGLCGLFLFGCGGGSTVAESYPKGYTVPLLNERTTSLTLRGLVIGQDEADHVVVLSFKNPGTDSVTCQLTVDDGATHDVNVDTFMEVSPHSFLIRGEGDTTAPYKDSNDTTKQYNGIFRFNPAAGLQSLVCMGDPTKAEVVLNPKVNQLYYLAIDNKWNYVSFDKVRVTEGAAP
ncbi:MAG: hypothetical protein MR890_10345 [Akkermansia muciniphila]|nr:hypothetical protein [Akkermansia muciniphila]